MPTVQIVDETFGSRLEPHTWTLEFMQETVTVREFIRRRIYEEVLEHNSRSLERFQGLVQPEESERVLNGEKAKIGRKLDWEAQYAKALEAFEQNGFFVLLEDRQAESLDEEFTLTDGSSVTFLKLVALVGG